MMENVGYTLVPLMTLLKAYKGDTQGAQAELDTFSCVLNRDVENFLRHKAIVFDQQGWSKTHLIYTSYEGKNVLCAYFTLANKYFVVKNNTRLSKTLKKRVANFGQYSEELKQYIVPSVLIGQIGKNDDYRTLIRGDMLLKLAIDEIRKVQSIIGGKFIYLECEDKEALKSFYKSNDFIEFARRELEHYEDDLAGQYLLQLLKYLK